MLISLFYFSTEELGEVGSLAQLKRLNKVLLGVALYTQTLADLCSMLRVWVLLLVCGLAGIKAH